MRRILIVAVLLLAACRPGDTASWVRMYETHPRAAMRHLRVDHPRIWARLHPPEPARWRPDTSCSQWAQTALDAGWSQDQWSTLNWIMYRESRCNPSAYNPSGASGLLQIMPFWQRDSQCAGSLFDAATNLRCGRHILAVQGWVAWSTY